MFTTSFLILAAIILVSGFSIWRAQKAHQVMEATLTADEVKTFNDTYRFKRRVDMPPTFTALAATSDRLRRTSTLGMLAVIAGIAYVIIAGPTP
jgi:hypothetical protein